MAKEPTNVSLSANGEPPKARRKTGPRTVKPVTGILLFKGEIQGDPRIVFDAMEALDARESDPELKMRKFVVPRKSKPTANPPTA